MQKLSTNQIARFFKLLYRLNRLTVFYIFFAYRQNTIRRLRRCCHFSIKMPFCPEKGQKAAKVGGQLEKINFFVYCSILAHQIFMIFCMKLQTIKGYKLTLNPFLKTILVLQILAIFGHFWLKNIKLLYLLNRLTIFYIFLHIDRIP